MPQQQATEPFRVPADWHPIVGSQEPTYLYHAEGKASVFYKQVYQYNWKKWFTALNLKPSLSLLTELPSAVHQ